jgi:hypothetical protein
MKTQTQKRNKQALNRLLELNNTDSHFANVLNDELERMLDGMLIYDVFGEMSQLYPCGDLTKDNFTMEYVDGVDN